MDLQKGQKIKVSDLTKDGRLQIDLSAKIATGEVDITCFGVDGQNKLSDDRYFIFYNQTSSPEGAISMWVNGETTSFQLDLFRLPDFIEKLVLTAAVEADNMKQLSNGRMVVSGDGKSAEFAFNGNDFTTEKAIIVAEIYKKDTIWRLSVVANGFNGGLSALLAFFGGEEIAPEASNQPTHQPTPAPTGPISLKKSGDAHKINLAKNNGQIHVNLNWNTGGKTGLFGLKNTAVDLDLACMFRLKTGEKGVIQALGGNFGAKDAWPYIFLDKDDRTGSSNNGENMFFTKPEMIEFAIVFAFIYEGVPNWRDTDAAVVLKQQNAPDIQIKIDNSSSRAQSCVIASLSANGNELVVKREELYFSGHREIDDYYGFGFLWRAGSKE